MAAISGAGCVTSGGSFGFIIFSGTSAAAPGMAGVAALLDQKLGSARGNLNPQLYPLAASVPAAFHDATIVSSGVSGCSANTASICNNSIPNASGSGAQAGFLLNTGYDEATGLGSLDVQVFLNNLSAPKITPTVTVTPASSSITTAQPLSVTVVVNGGSGNPTPTGSVTLTGGGYTSAATALSGGSATINIPADSLAPGSDTLTASYTPDSSSSSTYNSASGSAPVTVSVAAAAITSPTPGSTLTAASTTFTWNAGSGGSDGLLPVGRHLARRCRSGQHRSFVAAPARPSLCPPTEPRSTCGSGPHQRRRTYFTTTTPTPRPLSRGRDHQSDAGQHVDRRLRPPSTGLPAPAARRLLSLGRHIARHCQSGQHRSAVAAPARPSPCPPTEPRSTCGSGRSSTAAHPLLQRLHLHRGHAIRSRDHQSDAGQHADCRLRPPSTGVRAPAERRLLSLGRHIARHRQSGQHRSSVRHQRDRDPAHQRSHDLRAALDIHQRRRT